ncbi:hypothetical protein DLAC_00478 [Tieghemostelium lacteum]|uniref:Uncharacterized protein n=1 Tax=Tieghemostelium lacteum TaxID=361077 RepID=A0A152A9U0_TIELA|nr:hypothetical protein DLAC_00478 [Tieghemostelium lacteum]|eukprot:KYR02992.1 hypothetical protein DLAC_00478 [Tieghemostelium lacteum]
MMKAALEEYNQKHGGSSNSNYNTLPPIQKPDTMQDDTTRRRRGATVIGNGDRPNFNFQTTDTSGSSTTSSGAGDTTSGGVGANGKENESYNSIKMRYLRSLKIPISIPSKEPQQNISASAPIPIPIALNLKEFDSDDSDSEKEDEENGNSVYNPDQDLNSFQPGSLLKQSMLNNSNTLPTNTNNTNNNKNTQPNNQYSSIGSALAQANSNKPLGDISVDDNSSNNSSNSRTKSDETEVVPVRKDSRKHKFIPPHELMMETNTGTIENMINHSLPGNNRKKFGQ